MKESPPVYYLLHNREADEMNTCIVTHNGSLCVQRHSSAFTATFEMQSTLRYSSCTVVARVMCDKKKLLQSQAERRERNKIRQTGLQVTKTGEYLHNDDCRRDGDTVSFLQQHTSQVEGSTI